MDPGPRDAAGGCGPSGSRPTSPTCPAPAGCSARSPGGPARPSPAGWMTAARTGRTRSSSWRSTRARSTGRRSSRALPHAVIVVDHFHLVRLANQAVTKVRQRVTRQVLGRRGTTRDPAWANRRRLLRARERLTEQQFTRMWDEILAAGGHRASCSPPGSPRKSSDTCWRWPAPGRPGRRSATACSRSTTGAPAPTSPRSPPWPRPSRPGGRRSSPSSTPASPTPAPRQQPDGQRRRPDRVRVPQPRQPAPPSTVALQTDNDQLAAARVTSPLNFEEPLIRCNRFLA